MPTTLTGLLLFVVLLLPGFAYVATKERNTPRNRQSPFRETVEIVAASVASELVALAVFASLRTRLPHLTPDIGRVVREHPSYLQEHYGTLAVWTAGLLLAATIGSGLAGFVAGSRPPHSSKMSSWWEMFESWYPGADIHVGCTLDDGSYVQGTLVSYNDSADETADRDLILKQPVRLSLSGETNVRRHHAGNVSVSARRIVMMLVTPSGPGWTTSTQVVGEAEVAALAPVSDSESVAGSPDADPAQSRDLTQPPSARSAERASSPASLHGYDQARQSPHQVAPAPVPHHRPLGPSNPLILVPGADHGD